MINFIKKLFNKKQKFNSMELEFLNRINEETLNNSGDLVIVGLMSAYFIKMKDGKYTAVCSGYYNFLNADNTITRDN